MLLLPMPVNEGSEYGNAAVELQLGVVGAPVVTMPIPDIVLSWNITAQL
jgi:hypothetical protein